MKIVQVLFLVFGFLTLLGPALSVMVTASSGHGALERAVGTLGSAIARLPIGITEVMRLRPSQR